MEVMKQLRQRAIRDLVEQRPIRTQQELAAALRERGFRTTQATISRDVAELGLIKVTRDGTAAYALPPRLIEAETSGEDRLRKLMVDLPIEIHEAGLLLVVRTLPGLGACHRGRPRPGPLAGGRGLHRGRRHAVRRIPGPRLAAADQAPAACELARGRAGGLTADDRATVRFGRFDTPGPAATIRTRSELQARDTVARRLEFFPLSKTAQPGLPTSDHLHRGGPTTVNNKPTYLSKDGLEKLRSELDEMVSVKRPEVANRIHDAKEHGDLSENAEYEDAKNEQAFVEGRIQTLEALIKNATIIDENHSTDHVQIGSTVAVESPDGKEAFTIVGSAEAKPAEGRISNESPVGRALLGKKKGEKVVVKVPAGDFTYKIVGIT